MCSHYHQPGESRDSSSQNPYACWDPHWATPSALWLPMFPLLHLPNSFLSWPQCQRNLDDYVQAWRHEQLPSAKTRPSANSDGVRLPARGVHQVSEAQKHCRALPVSYLSPPLNSHHRYSCQRCPRQSPHLRYHSSGQLEKAMGSWG